MSSHSCPPRILTNWIYSGDGIPRSCIQSRIKALRIKAKSIAGPGSQSSPAAIKSDPATVKSDPAAVKPDPATPSKRSREPKSSTPKKRAKKNKDVKDEPSDDDTTLAVTPPSSDEQLPPSPVQKESHARISPRKVEKKNYKDITDPFIKFNDSHQNLFEDSKTSDEDSAGSDQEFEVPHNDNVLDTQPLLY